MIERCSTCGHAKSRHNDLGYCQVLYGGSQWECRCDGTDRFKDDPEVVASRKRLL